MTKNPAAYITITLSLLGHLACAQGTGSASSAAAPAKLETEEQKTIYTLGLLLGRNLKVFNLKPEELDLVKKGLQDSVTGAKPQVELEAYGPKVNELAQSRMSAGTTDEKKKGQEFADKAAKEEGATKSASGIVQKVIKPGDGKTPAADDMVKVHYEGRLTDGTVFDSSIKRGQPAEFPLHGVIPCWTESLQKMKVGEKDQIVCPSAVAYGDQGQPPQIPGGATLVFDVELLGVSKAPAAAGLPAGHPGMGEPPASAPADKPAEKPAKPSKK
jgi:FKBP-type peptidyl-prolyl cis-trans isomerase FkpA